MKPFNLQAALNGAPITDREGNPVELIAYVEKAIEDSQVVALHNDGSILTCHVNGQYWSTNDSPRDLCMAPVKRTVWVNLNTWGGEYYPTQSEADAYALPGRLGDKAYPIEIEE